MSNAIRRNWTRDELELALNLYCKLPFGRMHSQNPEIIRLSNYLNRTPSAVAMKLVNFAALDPSLPQRGLSAYSKLDKEVWNDFFTNEGLIEKTEEIVDKIFQTPKIQEDYSAENITVTGTARKGQNFFRETIMANYGTKCCISGISIPELLVAAHIVPWNTDKNNRLNPRNGLCINVLHHAAFDNGLIAIDDFKVVISKTVSKENSNSFLWNFEGNEISQPEKFLPAPEFLKYHYCNIFRK